MYSSIYKRYKYLQQNSHKNPIAIPLPTFNSACRRDSEEEDDSRSVPEGTTRMWRVWQAVLSVSASPWSASAWEAKGRRRRNCAWPPPRPGGSWSAPGGRRCSWRRGRAPCETAAAGSSLPSWFSWRLCSALFPTTIFCTGGRFVVFSGLPVSAGSVGNRDRWLSRGVGKSEWGRLFFPSRRTKGCQLRVRSSDLDNFLNFSFAVSIDLKFWLLYYESTCLRNFRNMYAGYREELYIVLDDNIEKSWMIFPGNSSDETQWKLRNHFVKKYNKK